MSTLHPTNLAIIHITSLVEGLGINRARGVWFAVVEGVVQVWGPGLKLQGKLFKKLSFRLSVQDLGFRVQSLGFKVQGFRV